MRKQRRATPDARHAKIDNQFRAICPWKPCRGRSELGVWAVAHLDTCTMNGKCAKCGKPITIGRDPDDD